MADGKRRIVGLDGLRGLAALGVVGMHMHAIFRAFPDWWPKGYLAVDFFMMLSGYVMARTYETRMAGNLRATAFFKLRYRRLWPTMAIASLAGIPYLWTMAGDPQRFAVSLVLNLALIPAPINNELFPLNGPAWSILAELIANALHAALLWRCSNRTLILFLAALLVALAWIAQFRGGVDFGTIAPHFKFALVRTFFAYTLGVLLWRWWGDRPPVRLPAALPYVMLPLFMLSWFAALGWVYDLAFVALACPVIIAGGLQMRGAPRWAVWSGLVSFPLYAIHFPVLLAMNFVGAPPLAALGVAIFAGVALTWLTQRRRYGLSVAAKA